VIRKAILTVAWWSIAPAVIAGTVIWYLYFKRGSLPRELN
jgi:hypothetical protein